MLNRLKTIFAPSPFKIGCLVVIIAALLFYSFQMRKPDLLAALDNRVTDAMFHWRGATPHTGQVVIVDIDEKSLAQIGQWPWPRHIIAQMIHNMSLAQPKVIGLDIVFAEEDRTSPKNCFNELQEQLPTIFSTPQLEAMKHQDRFDHDIILGNTFAQTPSVLGYVLQTSNDGLKTETAAPFPSAIIRLVPQGSHFQDLTLRRAYRAILNVPSLAQGESEGHFNVFPDIDGTVRKVPLFIELDGLPYPSLALEMARIGMGEKTLFIHLAESETAKNKVVTGVSVADHFLPTDAIGQIAVNFRGPTATFPYISAIDILEGRHLDKLKDKYVLIGTSAAGLLDLRATPFSNVYPGVEVHASVIDNILAGDTLVHDVSTETVLTYLMIIAGGLFLSALLAYSSALAGGLGGILLIEAMVLGNYYIFFKQYELVGVVYPFTTVIVVFMVVTLFNYFYEGKKRRFISGAFGLYVSPEIVAQLAKNPEKLSLQGEQKYLTVLFSDIRGFTTISEQLDSAQLGQLMNEYLTAMSNIIMTHQGTVDKYIGDAIMAIWGAPLDDDEHALNCVRSAFAMMSALNKLRPDWLKRGLPDMDIGIGINSGQMNVGNFGSEQRFSYTAMGDNVNLASRLEGSNKRYGTNIIISESTKEALGSHIFCRFLDLVRVKGKTLPVKIYEPLCEGAPPPSLKEIEHFEQALVHYRKQQFKEAREILQTLQSTTPNKIHEIYLERISHFIQNPPPNDWDGAFTFTSK